jgi:starch phosphorylase
MMNEKKDRSDSNSIKETLKTDSLKQNIHHHIVSYLGNDYLPPRKDTFYPGLAFSVRDRLIEDWLKTQRSFYSKKTKRIYYLSLEFLPGRFLMNYITNLQIKNECLQTLDDVDFTLEDLAEEEWDAGLGNGGLGRLASCYMDSMATLKLPAYGYGIRYDYGIFFQKIVNGYQVERSDNWLRGGNPWEIERRGFLYEVKFYGRTEIHTDKNGNQRSRWVDTDNVMAMACDTFVPGYGNHHVNNMRLWAAISSREFNLEEFHKGEYLGAMESKIFSENISKVLYPRDEEISGKELRLKQQYFFVAATFQDIMRRFKKSGSTFEDFPDLVAVHLNDTHPSISIAELMRLFLDEEGLAWNKAWKICEQTFAYTNHTILPEALEVWPVDLLTRVLPRHMEIIFEINHRFLEKVAKKYPGNIEMLSRLSLIREEPDRSVRMAHLAILGSHSVNGVAELHTRILKRRLFKDFDEFFPGRIQNVTNGITPRRWLLQANPELSELITSKIGPEWVHDLTRLKKLIPYVDDPEFCAAWQEVKRSNKKCLTHYILRKTGINVNPEMLFDVQVKRIHEYKRQLLNVLHVITLYNRLKDTPDIGAVPRAVIFGGKAAPGYFLAKLIIKLITSVAEVVNNDPVVNEKLKVIFLPNYCVSQAEKVIPAADLSEQISTAGMEASGTGNMKFALNGALTIGTLDGANIEIMEEVGRRKNEVGRENIFIFGLEAEKVEKLRKGGYDPGEYYRKDPELKKALDMIRSGNFTPNEPDLFKPIWDELIMRGDKYLVLADYRQFITAQEEVNRIYQNPKEWTRRSILNTANMGKFSSDRSVLEYARKIWNVKPLDVVC